MARPEIIKPTPLGKISDMSPGRHEQVHRIEDAKGLAHTYKHPNTQLLTSNNTHLPPHTQ